MILGMLYLIPVYSQEITSPCRGDIVNFCSKAKGKREVVQCLKQNKKDLSVGCKSQFTEAQAALKDCKSDMMKYCQNSEKGRGKMLKCLNDNISKISPICKSHVDRQFFK